MSVAVLSLVTDFSSVDIDARVPVTDPDARLAVGAFAILTDAAGNRCDATVIEADDDGASGVAELALTTWESA